MTRLIQGVLDFQRRIFGQKRPLFEELAKGQKPLALLITCSDSRISPDLLTQTQPGELFISRNAGNLVPPFGAAANGEEATIEYAVAFLKVRDVILCGHSRCGAMHGLLEPHALTTLPRVAAWLDYAKPILAEVHSRPGLSPDERLRLTIERNVLYQLGHLKTHPSVQAALATNQLRLHGWVYHFEKGLVEAYDPASDRFVALGDGRREKWLEGRPADEQPPTEWETAI